MSNGPLPISTEEVRRLALVRYLYTSAIEQSRNGGAAAAMSIMPLHDAAESLLLLSCERYGVGESKADFMRYFTLLESAGIAMPQREAMRRLNAARRSLKHQGVLPSVDELEGFRAAVTNFLHDGTNVVFGSSFDEITLLDLVKDEEVKATLAAALNAYEKSDFSEALSNAAMAFTRLRHLHYWSGQGLKTGAASLGSIFADGVGDRLASRLSSIESSIESFAEAIEVIGFGLSFRSYTRYRALAPIVHTFVGGAMKTEWLHRVPSQDKVAVIEAVNFVIDAAVQFRV